MLEANSSGFFGKIFDPVKYAVDIEPDQVIMSEFEKHLDLLIKYKNHKKNKEHDLKIARNSLKVTQNGENGQTENRLLTIKSGDESKLSTLDGFKSVPYATNNSNFTLNVPTSPKNSQF